MVGFRRTLACTVLSVGLLGPLGCTFDLEDVAAFPSPGADASTPDADASPAYDAPGEEVWDSWPGVDAQDAPQEVQPIDGCWPPTDAEFCALHSMECDVLDAVDACGDHRVVPCGSCSVEAHCEQGTCVAYQYAWKTGGWSGCSASCGGGTRTRTVWCERDDGTQVDDSKCGGGKPATTEACNTQPCCKPSCVAHDACGGDGCGGTCGNCDYDPERFCHNGYCVWQHGNNGSVTCHTLCAWGVSTCVDTSVDTCGDKIDTECFCW